MLFLCVNDAPSKELTEYNINILQWKLGKSKE